MISYEPLKKLMKERGVAVKDLNSAGIFINPVLLGKNDCSTNAINKLCKYFNCNISDLISYERNKDKEVAVKLKIDWQLLRDEVTKHNTTFSAMALKLNKKSEYFSSKARLNLSITLNDLLFVAKEVNCNPEEFLID
jgi:DNA-binding Xre family transcriptional regulator